MDGYTRSIFILSRKTTEGADLPNQEWLDYITRVGGAVNDCSATNSLMITQGTGGTGQDIAIIGGQVRTNMYDGLLIVLSGLAYIYSQDGIGHYVPGNDNKKIEAAAYNTEWSR